MEGATVTDPLARFRKMLDPKNWPVSFDEYDWLDIDGEIYRFVPSGDPFEERVYKPLFKKYRDYDVRWREPQ